ncbi:MAG TPA: SGNH family hydrolase [Xanthobacteraceae bacterium]|nr:SGNH family hydrolase [Xanthobacteraceae bacterium]
MMRSSAAMFLAITLAATLFAAVPARAQNPFTIFERLFGPRWQPEAPAKPEPPREREDPLVGTVYNSAAAADADIKRQEPPQEYVVVIGDTMAEQLAQGLAESFFTEHPEVAVIKKVRTASGHVRQDFYNWVTEAGNIVANERATAFVVMLGVNDRQQLRDEKGFHDFRSDRWREIYAKRIDDFLAKLKEKNTPIYVVGMPAISLQRGNADMQYVNEILRERAARAGVRYIDVWEGFVDEQGQFASTGAAMDGQMRRLRAGDGVHFTRFGSRKLAHFVERDLLRLFESRVRSPFLPYGLDQGPNLSGVRPAIGPVIPLTTPVGQSRVLEGSAEKANLPPVRIDENTKKTLVEGIPQAPVAGRADDFRWPRPAASN